MKTRLPRLLLGILILTALALSPNMTLADENPLEEDDEGLARVARISFLEGDVSVLRSDETEWSPAELNLPLLEGDQVYAGAGARCEIQLARGAYIRLTEKTALSIAMLSEAAAQFEITEGVALVRIDHFAASFDRFEVDTPGAALLLEKNGLYRINVGPDGDSEVVVRRGAADVTTEDGTFKVRDGHRLTIGSAAGRLEIAAESSQDEWDRWTYDRDTTIDQVIAAGAPDYVTTYETDYNSFYGASELSYYGSWTNLPSYGYCWLPRVASGWAPYRSGRWRWITRAGWSWVSFEPWGWAPYHYGRWVYISRLGWAWVPGFHSGFPGFGHYRWRPALVYFFNCPTPRGHYIAWYPLSPGERWRRSDRYARNRTRDPRGRRDRDPSTRNGISLIPIAGFNGSIDRPRRPDRDLTPWLGRNAQPGLPSIPSTRPATWSAVTPPAGVINRPVITRNLPNDSAGRARTLVVPQVPKATVKATGRLDAGGTPRFDQSASEAGPQQPARGDRQWRSPRLDQGEVIVRDQAPRRERNPEDRDAARDRPTPTRELDNQPAQPGSAELRPAPTRELNSPAQPRDLNDRPAPTRRLDNPARPRDINPRPAPKRELDDGGQPREMDRRPPPKRELDNGSDGPPRVKPRTPNPDNGAAEGGGSESNTSRGGRQRIERPQHDPAQDRPRDVVVKPSPDNGAGGRKAEPRSEPRSEKTERRQQPAENKQVRREERQSNSDANQGRSRKQN